MKIPKNKIQTGKYTTGNELYYKITQLSYKGYYYIFNNLYFVGKEYNPNAPELIKLSQTNSLLFNPSTFLYSKISGITSQMLQTPKITSIQPNMENTNIEARYFSKQINIQPIIIKEINKETYNSLQSNPLYQTTFIDSTQNLDKANEQMPGLKAFLLG